MPSFWCASGPGQRARRSGRSEERANTRRDETMRERDEEEEGGRETKEVEKRTKRRNRGAVSGKGEVRRE